MEVALIHTEEQTDGWDEASKSFSRLCERAKNLQYTLENSASPQRSGLRIDRHWQFIHAYHILCATCDYITS